MATLEEITNAIKVVLSDSSYVDTDIHTLINDALQAISGGVLMPDGSLSPPLPDLYATDTVSTATTLPYVDLPTDYQRNLFYVADDVDMRVHPVPGGDYYAFTLFMNRAVKKDLSLAGSVTSVCVKGNKLYYQGIPASSVDLTVQYYRKPATLSAGTDEPEGLPDHLSKALLKHYALKEIFGEAIEDGEDSRGSGAAYHEKKFFEFMTTLIRSIPEDDSEPVYYSYSGHTQPWNEW